MIQLLLIKDKDKVIRNYIVCPYCNIKILYTKWTPCSCPMCQTDILPIIPHLNHLAAKLRHYKTDPSVGMGFV